jgi:hypothetical protein
MSRLLFAILLALPVSFVLSQKMEVRNFNRDARIGFSNAAEFSLKKKFDSVTLKASQGKVSREKQIIYFSPITPGKDTIAAKFYFKNKLVHIDTVVFDVIAPEVFSMIGGGGELLRSRKISLPVLEAMGGVVFYIRVNDYHWEPISINSYRASVLRKDQCIYSIVESDNRFSHQLKAKLDLLVSGDLIVISEIEINSDYIKVANPLPGIFEIK